MPWQKGHEQMECSVPHGLGTLYRATRSERAFSFRLPPRTEDRFLFRSSFPDAIWQCRPTVLYPRARRSVLICHHVLADTNWFCYCTVVLQQQCDNTHFHYYHTTTTITTTSCNLLPCLLRTFRVSYKRMMFGWRSEAMIRASRCKFALTYSSLIFRVSIIFIATYINTRKQQISHGSSACCRSSKRRDRTERKIYQKEMSSYSLLSSLSGIVSVKLQSYSTDNE